MLSRVADSLYWKSRYLERAEHTARVLDVCLHRLDMGTVSATTRWEHLLLALKAAPPSDPTAVAICEMLTFDLTNGSSIAACMTAARANARQVREQISSEMWEQVNRLYLHARGADASSFWHGEPHEFYVSIKDGVHLFQGITDATMSHGEGWQFMRAGRQIERAIATATLLDAAFRPRQIGLLPGYDADDDWVALLKSCTAFEAYCKVYTAAIRPERVLEFLVLDAEFPRSLRFSADSIQSAVRAIASHTGARATTRVDRLAGRLRAALDYGQTDEIMADLPPYLAQIQRLCGQIHTAIHQTYIAYPADMVLVQ